MLYEVCLFFFFEAYGFLPIATPSCGPVWTYENYLSMRDGEKKRTFKLSYDLPYCRPVDPEVRATG